MFELFICLDISLLKKVVGSIMFLLIDSGHESQQIQEPPDAGGCLVTLVNKFLGVWEC